MGFLADWLKIILTVVLSPWSVYQLFYTPEEDH